jgi:hypothetical protein
MAEFKKKHILTKHNNNTNNKNNQNLSLGAKVFFDELKRLNKSSDIEFKETGVIDGGASIIFRIFKKYTLKHKMPGIAQGTTALYNIRRNKNQKSTQTSDTNSRPSNGCYCYTNGYSTGIYPPMVDDTINIDSCDGLPPVSQKFTGEETNIPGAGDPPLFCTNDTPIPSIQDSPCLTFNFIPTNPTNPTNYCDGCTCNGSNLIIPISQAVRSYDASINAAREKTGFVNSTLAPGKYNLAITGAGYVKS